MQKFALAVRGVGTRAAGGVLALGLMTSNAMAQVDVSDVTADLALVKTAVVSIGVAVLAIFVGIKLYKWVKQAL